MDMSAHFLYYRSDYMDQLLTDPAAGNLQENQSGTDGCRNDTKSDEWTWEDYLATSFFFTKKYNPDSPTSMVTLHMVKLWDRLR